MVAEEKRFVADVMLGRLAKWLRIIGYDTLYYRRIEDNQLIRMAVNQNRILLTRDVELFNREGFRRLFVRSEDLKSQLVQVMKETGVKPRIEAGIRCPLCNELLQAVQRDRAKDFVPAYVYATQRDFTRCPSCRRIFWKGTHWQRIQRHLHEMGLIVPSANP